MQALLVFAQRFGGLVRDIQNDIPCNSDMPIWEELNTSLENALIPYNLDINTEWGNPHMEVDIWERYGQFLDAEITRGILRLIREI